MCCFLRGLWIGAVKAAAEADMLSPPAVVPTLREGTSQEDMLWVGVFFREQSHFWSCEKNFKFNRGFRQEKVKKEKKTRSKGCNALPILRQCFGILCILLIFLSECASFVSQNKDIKFICVITDVIVDGSWFSSHAKFSDKLL